MSLHYLIDGYNLLYALPDIPTGSWEKKREALLRLIVKERPYGNNKASVIFDSREGAGSQSRHGEIQVIYTAGETADDWISHHVRRTANPRILIVVTNDQGLRRLIRGTGAKVMGTEEFWKLVKTAPRPPAEQQIGLDAEEITEELKKKWLG
jgi:predicted RNA-binding protein with PIN domain